MSTIAPEQAEFPLILALDLGTSSVRAILFDCQGRDLRGLGARRVYKLWTNTKGASEADPDALLEMIWDCVDDVLAESGELARQIGGVAICTLVSNILGLDKNGQAITPLITYADTRAASEVAGLQTQCDEEAVHDRTGCHFHPSYLPARFRWLARKQPDLFHQVARWVSIGEYLELKLFGEAAVSYSVASWTGLLDRRQLTWDKLLLTALPVEIEQLSPLTDVNVPRRDLRRPFVQRWPSLHGVPWFPAVGDGAAANVGSGCASSDRVALTMGTSAAVRIMVPNTVERVPRGLWCYRVDQHRSLLGGALSEGGNVLTWLKAILHLPGPADLELALATMEPDAHGLTVLPFLAGERSSGWASDARATIHGLSLATTPPEILRAGLEAVAYRLALVFNLLRPWFAGDCQVVVSGGALLNSAIWLQIMADVLGRPLVASRVREASARGAALLALAALGALADLDSSPPFLGTVTEPDSERHARYCKALERQQALYEKLIE